MPSRSSLGRRAVISQLAALAIATALLASCSGGSTAGTSGGAAGDTVGTTLTSEQPAGPPTSGGSLTYGIATDTNSLNPYVGQWSGSTYIVANAFYEPLAALGTDGQARPYLAEAITPSPDFKQWTIHLRPDVTFSNGEKLNADALITNLHAGQKSALISAALAPVSSVTATDDLTVVVAMSTPWSTFDQLLTSQAGYMAAPALLAASDAATADPIGTGPFVFQSRVQDSFVKVAKNSRYWQAGKPYLDGITFKVLPDDSSRSSAMDTGDLDAMEINTSTVLSKYLDKSKNGEIQLLTNAGFESNEFVIALNTTSAPFDDLTARQALAYAIDQEQISKTVYNGVWPAAWGNFEEGSPYFISKQEAGYPDPDPQKAKELADQYRQKHGGPITFRLLLGSDTESALLGQFIQQELQPAGIDVQVQQTDTTTSIGKILTGDYQAGFFAMWSVPTLDKGYFFVASKPSQSGISLNYTRMDDPAITKAMDDARSTAERNQQIADYDIVQKQMATNLDRIFLYHGRNASAFDKRVHGFTTATFPGMTDRAFAPDVTISFYTAMWVSR